MDEETNRIQSEIEGMLWSSEPPVLYDLGKRCSGKGVVVEIGSWKGRSTVLLARGSLANSKMPVYAIDTFQNKGNLPTEMIREDGQIYGVYGTQVDFLNEFRKNIKKAGVDNIVVEMVGLSEDTSKDFHKDIEILFIDGCHEYQEVCKDIDNWCPKLINNGLVAFHDCNQQDVSRAVKEKIIDSPEYSLMFCQGSIWCFKKSPGNKLMDNLNMINWKLKYQLWKYTPTTIKNLIRFNYNG